MDATINCHFAHKGGRDYLPLKALHHQLLHLAGYLTTYSSVATVEGNHQTNISTITENDLRISLLNCGQQALARKCQRENDLGLKLEGCQDRWTMGINVLSLTQLLLNKAGYKILQR